MGKSKMARKRNAKGPQFVRYFGPIIETLQELGGSGRPSEVEDSIIEKMNISNDEQTELLTSGQSRLSNQIHWARFYLAKAGYIDASKRGVWNLTEKGLSASLTRAKALDIFKEVQTEFKTEKDQRETNQATDEVETDELPDPERADYRTELMNILRDLPPSSFERLCQRLLRESGFQQVNVTGRTGDGGIDGNGVLEINPFVSFRVLFQCKRYSGSVAVSQVRDFRGAMMGRADKGIIITTGTFTSEARQEAVRDGVPPIELVNGKKPLDMFEYLELGLKPKTTYEIDNDFFDEFRGKQ
jgi:restriction system protein